MRPVAMAVIVTLSLPAMALAQGGSDPEMTGAAWSPYVVGALIGMLSMLTLLLLEDFTVIQVMLSAIVVGAIGIYAMRRLGLVELHLKPTRYASNVVGGLIFGAGFAMAVYCPGTAAAALGQGNFDAAIVMIGMLLGSYLYAELSGWLGRTVERWGDRGELTFLDLLWPAGPSSATRSR